MKAVPGLPFPLHPWDGSILVLGEAWPGLEEVLFVLPSQDTIYKHHSFPHIKIRVCLAQGSCVSLEFLSISRLLSPAGSPPFPGAWSYFWILWVYQQSFTSMLFLFPLPIPAVSEAGLEQLCESPPGLPGEGGTLHPDLNPGITSTSSRPLPTPALLKLLISETESKPFTFQIQSLRH